MCHVVSSTVPAMVIDVSARLICIEKDLNNLTSTLKANQVNIYVLRSVPRVLP